MNKKWLFLWTISLGVLAHAGALVSLHHSHYIMAYSHFKNRVVDFKTEWKCHEKEKRRALLAKLFHRKRAETLQIKEELHELSPEMAPPVETPFIAPQPQPSSECVFDFENTIKFHAQGEWQKESVGVLEDANRAPLLFPTFSNRLKSASATKVSWPSMYCEEPGVLASSEHFDIQVEYAPKRFRPGYVFKISLLPRGDIQFKRIQQNFYFLIDRSNSIPRTRYLLNKRAVAEALEFLKPGDCFNILIFDHRVVRFQEQVVPCTKESLAAANEFLDRQGHGGYFAATELYASLGKIIPKDVAEQEINNAILLSDGDTYLSQEKQRITIGGWTAQNHGKMALYAVTSGTGNNISLLELLSSFNKGSLIYAHQHSDVASRLAHLMRTLQNPIGKEIVITPVTEEATMHVILQPKSIRLPHLYQHRPFVIYGSTNKLSDFYLFIQGTYYDCPFDIKKRISFSEAKLDAYTVERGWTQLVAQEFYERYFEEGNLSHLEGAKQLLSPFNLPIPLIDE